MNSDCVFCNFIHKGEPRHELLWEDEEHVAFLTIEPIAKGHTLVVPKEHLDYEFDMEQGRYLSLMNAVRTVASVLKTATNKERIVSVVEGFSVPHVHVHLIPSNQEDGGVHIGGVCASAEDLADVAGELRPFFAV